MIMEDNSDVQQIRDGKITDMRMEMLLEYFNTGKWNEETLDAKGITEIDQLFNEVVREFVDPKAPSFYFSRARLFDCLAVQYAAILNIEFTITYPNGRNWPGAFSHMPDAYCAVAIYYPNSDETTSYAPGKTVNHAVVSAIVQYARERSLVLYNQGDLLVH